VYLQSHGDPGTEIKKNYMYTCQRYPVHGMTKSCHKCSSASGAQCVGLRGGGKKKIALAGTARPHDYFQLPAKFWSL
jgi:hypothetical protein